MTLTSGLERRPDLMIYLNGIAIGVMELKNASTDIGEAMRQLLSNQKKEFNEWFFSTAQSHTPTQIPRIKEAVERQVKLRDIIRKASGETLDLKAYEAADMRHLIDTYIEAREPRKTSQFDEIGLLEVIVNRASTCRSGGCGCCGRLSTRCRLRKPCRAEVYVEHPPGQDGFRRHFGAGRRPE